jgi:hypothetical protein
MLDGDVDAATGPLVPLTGYSLSITVEDGYLKAYANPPDSAGIVSFGLQGRVREELFDGVRQLVDLYLEAQSV